MREVLRQSVEAFGTSSADADLLFGACVFQEGIRRCKDVRWDPITRPYKVLSQVHREGRRVAESQTLVSCNEAI